MKKKHLVIAIFLGSFSLMHATWHAWSAKFETHQDREKTSNDRTLAEELIRQRNKEIRARTLSRNAEMLQFRLGRSDPNSLISKLPLEPINRIHFWLKKIDQPK